MFFKHQLHLDFPRYSDKLKYDVQRFTFKSYEVITLARSSSELIPENTLEKMVRIFKAIANPFRLQIVNVLLSGEFCVEQLVDILGSLQSNTSQQLGRLRSRGIVKSRRDRYKKYYSLANDSIKRIVESIIAET